MNAFYAFCDITVTVIIPVQPADLQLTCSVVCKLHFYHYCANIALFGQKPKVVSVYSFLPLTVLH